MSWSTSFPKPVRKAEVEQAIDSLAIGLHGASPSRDTDVAADQLRAAKQAAKWLVNSVPGPYVLVTLSGHAHGVGWQKHGSSANECINVNIVQMCDEDMKYHT